jgi:L-threonine-O-3-phosphate decarboxylase
MKRIDNCRQAVHGGLDLGELRRLGLQPSDIVDCSVCTNPFGPSPRAQAALANVPVERYPDREATELREALAARFDLAPECVVAGNGASELIWLTALALLRYGDRVLLVGPTYSEYARAAALVGATPTFVNAAENAAFAVPTAEIERHLDRARPRLVFLCNPNNPTGAALAPEQIVSWARRFGSTVFVVDEAYQPFTPDVESLLRCRSENIVVLRSLTKDHALAGLRLGYAVANAEVAAKLCGAQPPWSVNAMAQAAGVAALGDDEHLRTTLARLAEATRSLRAALADLGLKPLASAAHFFLVRVGDADALRSTLLQRGILVRSAASFGLPAYVRLAARRPEENARLLAALREVLS